MGAAIHREPRKIRKIVLIEPRSPDIHVWTAVGLPRLGVVLLGTIMERRGYDVTVMIEDKRPLDMATVFSADLVGISAITPTASRSYRLARAITARGIPVVMGGPHPTHRADEAIGQCDFVVRGEGEAALPALVEALERGSGFDRIAGLTYHTPTRAGDGDGDAVVHVAAAPLDRDLDQWPDPDFGLVQGWSSPSFFSSRRIVPIQTSRGCPHDCSFCTVTTTFGRGVRHRSVERVLAEMERYDLARTHFFIYDDNFAANRRRTREMVEAFRPLAARGLRWSAQVRADVARDEDLLDRMAAAGCDTFYIGLESVNEATLAATNKRQSLAEVGEHLRRIKARRIAVHGMFVLGFDTDGPGTMERTVRFAREHGLFSVQLMMLTPLPGSRLAREFEAAGRVLHHSWSLYDAHHVVFQPAQVTPEELMRWYIDGHDRFYGPRKLVAALLKRDWAETAVSVYAAQLNARWRWHNAAYLRSLRQWSTRTPPVLSESPQPA